MRSLTVLWLHRPGEDDAEVTESMVSLIRHVIETEGVAAVHGLFCRGGHAPYYVEVLNRDEETRLRKEGDLESWQA